MLNEYLDIDHIKQQLTAMVIPAISPQVTVYVRTDQLVCKLMFFCPKFEERLYCTRAVSSNEANTTDEVINLVFQVWENALSRYFANRDICYETYDGSKPVTNPSHNPRCDYDL